MSSAVAPAPARAAGFDVGRIRAEFPILGTEVRGRPLVYLDNAATTQKPRVVDEALTHYYRESNANVHRGVHLLSEKATAAFEDARACVRRFINAPHEREVIFVRGATEAINLVASSFSRLALRAGDEVVVTGMEHHSNIVPWQLACAEHGATLRVIPFDDAGVLDMEAAARIIGPRTRLVGVVHVSNALGTVNPVRELVALAHGVGARVLVDGAQAMPHFAIDVQSLDCDFYVFSGHKLFGPTGIGVLWGRSELLEAMPPWQSGGDMIRTVRFEGSTWNDLPWKFEAGTPDIAGAIGLAAAIRWLQGLDWAAVMAHEHSLLMHAEAQARELPGLRIIGTAPGKASVMSFVTEGIHPHDLGTILDHEGVAIRTGHHCAMPVMERYGIPATARASFALYNTHEEVDVLIRALGRAREVFS